MGPVRGVRDRARLRAGRCDWPFPAPAGHADGPNGHAHVARGRRRSTRFSPRPEGERSAAQQPGEGAPMFQVLRGLPPSTQPSPPRGEGVWPARRSMRMPPVRHRGSQHDAQSPPLPLAGEGWGGSREPGKKRRRRPFLPNSPSLALPRKREREQPQRERARLPHRSTTVWMPHRAVPGRCNRTPRVCGHARSCAHCSLEQPPSPCAASWDRDGSLQRNPMGVYGFAFYTHGGYMASHGTNR